MSPFLRITCLAASLLVTQAIQADGLPFDPGRTHLLGKTVVLKLSAEQEREVARRRTLTLSRPQLQTLRKEAGACPPRLQVLTNRYDDCTCGMSSLAVWFRPGEVEVPVFLLPKRAVTWEDQEELGPMLPDPPGVILDMDLKMWFKGRPVPVAGFKKLLQRWRTAGDPDRRTERGLSFAVMDPPPILPAAGERKLKAFAQTMRTLARQNGIDLFVFGDPEPDR